MAVVRDTIVDGKLHVAGDIVAAGIVAYQIVIKKFLILRQLVGILMFLCVVSMIIHLTVSL